MANWSNPTLISTYIDVLGILKDRDVDALTLQVAPAVNPPVGAIRFNRTTNIFEEWNGTSYVGKILGTAGGGTGSGASFTLGTMASQNANAVAITGGSITVATLSSTGVFVANGATLSLYGNVTMAIPNLAIGTDAAPVGKLYLVDGLRLPVGVNKYLVS